MSQKIDPREVLEYLNELGYTNITAALLKDFIKDLKKLIKYDLRTNLKNHSDLEYAESSNSLIRTNDGECPKFCDDLRDRSNSFGSVIPNSDQPTAASKVKEVSKREKQISVHIQKKQGQINHVHCVHVEPSKINLYKECHKENLLHPEPIKTSSDPSDPSRIEVTTESTVKSIRPNSKQSTSSKLSSCMSKKKPSFIRPCSIKSKTSTINKCDPVALYHYYQMEWKKAPIPGQDNRADLRWAIREKMLGEPKTRSQNCCRKKNQSHRG